MNKRLTRILGHRVTERPLLSSDSLTHITLLTTAIQFGTLVAQLGIKKGDSRKLYKQTQIRIFIKGTY